ncbi:hypothetical protein EEDFHM_03906 [Methylorubrum populi]
MLSPPAMPHPMTVSARARREVDRDRKRAERAARRESGAPDPRALDAALVDALRDALQTGSGTGGLHRSVRLDDVLRRALGYLRVRTNAGVPLRREAVHAALSNRLAPPPV